MNFNTDTPVEAMVAVDEGFDQVDERDDMRAVDAGRRRLRMVVLESRSRTVGYLQRWRGCQASDWG